MSAGLRLVPPDMTGIWLVLTLCWRCRASTGYYCTAHDVRSRSTSGNRKAAPQRLENRSLGG